MTFNSLLPVMNRSVNGASLAAFRILCGLGLLAALALLATRAGPLLFQPKFFFSYAGLSWLQLPPAPGLYGLLGFMGLCALAITLGLFYRAACALFFAGATYLFLLDRTFNHDVLYLGLALIFLMIFLPVQSRWSLDARRGGSTGAVPLWAPLAAGAMLVALLLAAGLALAKVYVPDGGSFAAQLKNAGVQTDLYTLMFASAGLLILALPGWPQGRAGSTTADDVGAGPRLGSVAVGALAVFVLFHALFPLRALMSRSNTGWLDLDLQPLRAKECHLIFNVLDEATNRQWNVNPGTRMNQHQMESLAREPKLVMQFAQHLAGLFAGEKYGAPQAVVRARAKCTRDGRGYALVLDPQRDLSRLTSDELMQARIPFNTDIPERPRELRLKGKPDDAPPVDPSQ